jgi:hypothetical protein
MVCKHCGTTEVLTATGIKLNVCWACVNKQELFDLIDRKKRGENIDLSQYAYLIHNNGDQLK